MHFISLALAALLGGMGMADGGAFAPVRALSIYILPQSFWLVIDTARRLITRPTNPHNKTKAGPLYVSVGSAIAVFVAAGVFTLDLWRLSDRENQVSSDSNDQRITLLCEGIERLIGREGEVTREGPTRTVLRVDAESTAILDHSSPSIMSVFACDMNCTLTVTDVAITGITQSPDSRWRFHISRLTGDYDGFLEFPDLPTHSVETGRCQPTNLARQF